MRIVRLGISHFKSIRKVVLEDIENALILVGQNNTGENDSIGCNPCCGRRLPDTAGGFR